MDRKAAAKEPLRIPARAGWSAEPCECKNPGGWFLNGAMAREESLAASGGNYVSLTKHGKYFDANRAFGTMRDTSHAIYSPGGCFLGMRGSDCWANRRDPRCSPCQR